MCFDEHMYAFLLSTFLGVKLLQQWTCIFLVSLDTISFQTWWNQFGQLVCKSSSFFFHDVLLNFQTYGGFIMIQLLLISAFFLSTFYLIFKFNSIIINSAILVSGV